MRLLPKNRWGRRIVTVAAILATLALGYWVEWYRPWEAHYKGRPTSRWARALLGRRHSTRPPSSLPAPFGRWMDQLYDAFESVTNEPETGEWYGGPNFGYVSVDGEVLDIIEFISDPALVPVLVELLDYPDGHIRAMTAHALSQRGPSSRRLLLVALARMLRTDKNPFTRKAAAAELSKTSPDLTKEAVSALLACFRTETESYVRDAALLSLRKLDPDAAREWEEAGGGLERP
jgi:hypothetical protein